MEFHEAMNKIQLLERTAAECFKAIERANKKENPDVYELTALMGQAVEIAKVMQD